MTLDDAWIVAELAICEAGTEGPWETHSEGGTEHYAVILGYEPVKTVDGRKRTFGYGGYGEKAVCVLNDEEYIKYADPVEQAANATFIASARTGYPAALKALQEAKEALRKCVAAVEGVLDVNPRRDAREVLTDAEFLVHHYASAALAKIDAPEEAKG